MYMYIYYYTTTYYSNKPTTKQGIRRFVVAARCTGHES